MQTAARSQSLDWVKQFGSTKWDEGVGIATDGNGNVYSAGHFHDTIDFDPGPGTFNLIADGWKDIFISKLDAAGNFIWAKQIGGAGWVECNAITVDRNGNIYITGSFLGTVDFDPSAATLDLTATGDINIFICKFNTSGNLVWAKQIGGTLAVNAYAIAVDNSGNVYTTGYFDATADFDPGPGTFKLTVFGYSDIFVSKLDASGNFVWAKQMGGTIGEVGYAIAVDGSGNVYTTGTFVGTVDFDPGAGSFNLSTTGPGDGDIFLSKLDASGSFVWAKQLGGEEAHAMALDNIGNVYVGGSGYNSWNGISINKFDPAGNSIWTKQIPAYSCWSLALDNDHNVYTTGQFFGTKDFDPGAGIFNLTSLGNGDSYISKLDSAGNFIWAKQLWGTEQVWSRSLAVDGNDNINTTGYFSGTTDFDPAASTFHLTAIGSYDIFIHKMKPDNLGMEETNLAGMFHIYPNPTTGKFIVEFEHRYYASELVLSNMMGQTIEKISINNRDRIELEINEANGIYILTLYYQDGQKAYARIVKN